MKYLREHILTRVTFLTFLVFLVDILTHLSQLVDAMDAYWDYQGEWHLGLCLCHPLAMLGRNNHNNCDYYYRNYLAYWLYWDRTIAIITIILLYHHHLATLGRNNYNYRNYLALPSSDNNGIDIIIFCHSKLQELCLCSCLKSFCLNYSGLNFSALTLSFSQQKWTNHHHRTQLGLCRCRLTIL